MSHSRSSNIYNITMYRHISDETYKNIGSIEYACKGKTVNILMLFIDDTKERGKGYGYGLILLSICNIIKTFPGAYHISKIHLDDDSDGSMTTNSIYYKLGFRIFNGDEVMEINFLKPNLSNHMKSKLYVYDGQSEAESVYHRTIYDLYENAISIDKYAKIISSIIKEVNDGKLKFTIFNDEKTEDLDISKCLNIQPEIEENSHYLRKKQKTEK